MTKALSVVWKFRSVGKSDLKLKLYIHGEYSAKGRPE
jgi:hypothetical protein